MRSASLPWFLAFELLARSCFAADSPVQVSIASSPSSNNVVQSNFFGISFELSFMNEYFGNDTSTIPQAMLNYLGEIRSRTQNAPVRVRVGGNSGDISTYVPSQSSPMLFLTDPNANANNQPVNYGPMLWEVMNNVSQKVNGVEYLIGLSIDQNNNDSIIAGDAARILGSNLDSMLLGNEPDLYTAHKQRPNVDNYTVQDYIGEYGAAVKDISNTSAGNLVNGHTVAGPTVCCNWDLASLLQEGFYSTFTDVLKYITLQHYPQNNCFGSYQYGVPYYLQHSNVVELASWQKPGIDIVTGNTTTGAPRMLMSEFNSASCGGIPGISDTFAVGSLWSIDYALQMASVGYAAAYIHTREQGISYNLVTPPSLAELDSGTWTTNPPYYALLTTAEILASDNGSIVTDLNIGGSMSNNLTYAGYGVYDAKNSSLTRVALFNYGNSSEQFALPSGMKAANLKNATVKYLSAPSIGEKYSITWGGQTLQSVGDGKLVAANTSNGNQNIDCSNGCNVTVPGPSLAVVFLDTANSGSSDAEHNTGARIVLCYSILLLFSALSLGILTGF